MIRMSKLVHNIRISFENYISPMRSLQLISKCIKYMINLDRTCYPILWSSIIQLMLTLYDTTDLIKLKTFSIAFH